jgi:flavoprotein
MSLADFKIVVKYWGLADNVVPNVSDKSRAMITRRTSESCFFIIRWIHVHQYDPVLVIRADIHHTCADAAPPSHSPVARSMLLQGVSTILDFRSTIAT